MNFTEVYNHHVHIDSTQMRIIQNHHVVFMSNGKVLGPADAIQIVKAQLFDFNLTIFMAMCGT